MNVEIEHGPGNAIAHITLQPNETCISEGGAMIAMRGSFDVQTATHARKRSIMGGIKRMFGGESFFQNYYKPLGAPGELYLSATLPGDMLVVELGAVAIIAEGGAFVARAESIEMDTAWQGLKTVFSGESLFWLRLHGTGKVVLNSFGAIYPIDIDGEYIAKHKLK